MKKNQLPLVFTAVAVMTMAAAILTKPDASVDQQDKQTTPAEGEKIIQAIMRIQKEYKNDSTKMQPKLTP